MTGVKIKMDRVFYWFVRGDFVRISGNSKRWIVMHKTSRDIYLAPWTWIGTVISWNPCNSLELAVGSW